MNIVEFIEQNTGFFIIGILICMLLILILLIVQSVHIGKLNKKYNAFLSGKDAASLEEIIVQRMNEVEHLNGNVASIEQEIQHIKDTLLNTYQKMSIVKYDAFKEMGGKLSFVLALLDDQNNGFLINAMHSSREGCYTYAKEILHGESYVVLSNEEKQALEEAMNKHNYME